MGCVSKKSMNRLSIIVVGFFFFALCLYSVYLSGPYFSSGMNAQSAHVLSSMRALDDWGFFTLRGVSSFIPRSREIEVRNLHKFTLDINEAIYLSYPSGWLNLPYATFRILHAVFPSLEITPQFLSIYNIVIDRWMTAAFFGVFLFFFLGIVTNGSLERAHRSFLSLIGCAWWLVSPPVLYWTQNTYGMDQAIIPWITLLLALVARNNAHLSTVKKWEHLLLFVVVFVCCFIDWYGVVASCITVAVCLVSDLCPRRTSWKRLSMVYGTLLVAALCVGGIFYVQLQSFSDGWDQLFYKYGIRSAYSQETVGIAHNLFEIWTSYIVLPHLPYLILLCALPLAGALLYRSTHKKELIAIGIALMIPPLLWTLLLPQHSIKHPFSLLKFAIPTITLLLCIPTYCVMLLKDVPVFLRRSMEYALYFILICSIGYAVSRSTYTPLVPQEDDAILPLQTLIQTYVGPDDIPLSDTEIILGSRPTHKIWYMNRWIYPPAILHSLLDRGLLSSSALHSMHPVYIRTDDTRVSADIEKICAGLWKDTGLTILSVPIRICRTDALRGLYLPYPKEIR